MMNDDDHRPTSIDVPVDDRPTAGDCFRWRVDCCHAADKNLLVLTQRSPLSKPAFLLPDDRGLACRSAANESSADRYIPQRHLANGRALLVGEKTSDDSDLDRPESQLSTPYLRKTVFGRLLKAQFMSINTSHTNVTGMIANKTSQRLLKFGIDDSRQSKKRLVLRTSSRPTALVAHVDASQRMYETTPYKTELATDLPDNFYLNVLDWSSKNMVAAPLDSNITLWHQGTDSSSSVLVPRKSNIEFGGISSLKFSPAGDILLIGNDNGICRAVCAETGKEYFKTFSHLSKVSVSAWLDETTFALGSHQGSVSIHDSRTPTEDVSILTGSQSNVCGMAYCQATRRLATGCNNNLVTVWDIRKSSPEVELTEHRSAVKAVAWNPHERGQLVTGGGYKDKKLRVFNTFTESLTKTVRMDSQITGILFSSKAREFVTTHGYVENDIRLWNCDALESPLVRFRGHSGRVIYSALSPSGIDLATGSGDRTIKFWHVFYGADRGLTSTLGHTYRELR